MKWREVGEESCSIARSLSLVGDRWTMLILRNAFLRMRRFEDFQASLGVTRHVLAGRLKRLVDAGILHRQPYQQAPLRHEYRLTDMGKALHPVILSLAAWGDAWLDGGKGPPVLYRHDACGKVMKPALACSECGEVVHSAQVTPLPGPGLRPRRAVGGKAVDGSRAAPAVRRRRSAPAA